MLNVDRRSALCRFIFYGWLFFLVLALIPWTANPVKPIKDLVTAAAALAVCAAGIGLLPRTVGDMRKKLSPPLCILGLWLCWSVVSALASRHHWLAVDELRILIPWLVLSFYASFLFHSGQSRKTLALVICLAVCLSSLYGLCQYLGFDPFPWVTRDIEEYRGLPATFGNPNFAGHSLILVIIVAAGLIAAAPRSAAWLLLPLPLFHLYQTHMRGALLALGAAVLLVLLYVFFRNRPGSSLKKISCLFAVLLLIALAGLAFLLPLSKKMSGYYFPTGGSLILRYNGYYGAARMALDHPILGVGPGNYSPENIPYWTFYERRWFADQNKRNTHVHCDLLESAVETGFPGMILHLLLFILLIVQSLYVAFESGELEKRRWGVIFAAFFLAFLVDGLFGFNLRIPVSGALFYLAVGVFSAFWHESTENNQGRQERPSPSAVPDRGRLPELPPQKRLFMGLISIGLVSVSLGCAWWALRVFQGELDWYRGNSALAWAERNSGDAQVRPVLLKAESAAARGFKKCFWDTRYSNLLGHIALKKGDTDQAIVYYTHSHEMDPYHPHTAANLARAWLSRSMQTMGRESSLADLEKNAQGLETAEKHARYAAVYCPESPYVQDVLWRIVRAEAQLAEMRGEDAVPLWKETRDLINVHLRDVPLDLPAARRALFSACIKLDDLDTVESVLTPLAEDQSLSSEFWEFYRRFAREKGQMDHYLDALLKQCARALSEKSDRFVLLFGYLSAAWAEVYTAEGGLDFYIDEALRHFPESLALWALAIRAVPPEEAGAVLKEKTNRTGSSSCPEFIKLFAAEPQDEKSVTQSASLLAREAMQGGDSSVIGDLAVFADVLLRRTESLALEPGAKAGIYANLATVYLEGALWEEADRYFAQAIALVPPASSARLKASRSRALEQLGRLPDALRLSREAWQQMPDDPLVLLIHGRILRLTNQNAEAAALLEKAAGRFPAGSPLQRQAHYERALAEQHTAAPAAGKGE